METVIDKLIKHWEEKIGIEVDKDEVKAIKEFAYRMVDQLVEATGENGKRNKRTFPAI